MAPASVSIAAREVGATLHGDRNPRLAFVVHRSAASARLCPALFPLRTLWDKAPPAAADNRPQAPGRFGAALETTPFFVPDQCFAGSAMPKRTDLSTILVIGAGPIVIGQACEFDYSGTQACKALKAEGYRIVLVNSNPATIMTDPDIADATYVEPITPEIVARIIEKERPDALLPTMGGQTAL